MINSQNYCARNNVCKKKTQTLLKLKKENWINII